MLIRKAVGVNLEQSVIITLNISGVQRVKKKKKHTKKPTLLLLLSGCVEVFHQCSFFVNTLASLQHMLALPFISVTRCLCRNTP